MYQFIGYFNDTTTTEKLQKYTDLKEETTRICKQNALFLSKNGNCPKNNTTV
jgi:hypothetical protein